MMRLFTALLAISFWLAANPAHAQWKGEAGLGLVSASGNTESDSFSGNVALARKSGRLTHNLAAELYKASTDGVDTADRLGLGYKLDYSFTERMYGWGSLRWDADEFANIDSRQVLGGGVGYKFLLGPIHELDAELGVGARKTSFVDATADESGAVVIGALNYTGRLNSNVTLTQRFAIESGSDNTSMVSTSGLKVKMSDAFSLGLAYVLKRNSDIVGARGKKNDALTTVNLIYSF